MESPVTGPASPLPTLLDPSGKAASAPEKSGRIEKTGKRSLHTVPGYEVLEELGRGSMGVVYRARQVGLDRIVALKMIQSGAHAGAHEVARFKTEAEAIARLHHPNIIQVFEIGEWQPHPDAPFLPFFSLEYCSGGTLAKKLAGTPLPAEQAASLVQALARAMQTAHTAGVIHRDLKPANVLLAGDGTARITDFGLARKTDEPGMTNPGAIMGTPSYMAPEQATIGGQVGPSADIYALGAILYECLTGRPPFRAASAIETLRQVLVDDPVHPSQLQPGVSRDLETITLKCLRKEASNRYESAEALADDLGRFLLGEPIVARPVGVVERVVKWSRRRPVVAILSAALIFVTVVGFVSLSWALGVAVAALVRADQARIARVRAEVDGLLDADPQAVPALLASLRKDEAAVLPSLKKRWETLDQPENRMRRMRVGLALVSHDPSVIDPLIAWEQETNNPAEMLLVLHVLQEYWDGGGSQDPKLLPELWDKAEKTSGSERLPILALLAVLDPDSNQWKKAGPWAAEPLSRVNLLQLGTWITALQPVRKALLPSLIGIYRTRGGESRREVVAEVLAKYARDDPAILVDLILDADPQSYALFRPLLDQHRAEVVEMLEAKRDHEAGATWPDKPFSTAWPVVDEKVAREVEQAQGMIQERFAFCQSLPLQRVQAVAQVLATSGYQLLRVRPWMQSLSESSEVRTALVWVRSTEKVVPEWKLETGLSPERVSGLDERFQRQGFIPVDAASYFRANSVSSPSARISLLPRSSPSAPISLRSGRVDYAVLWQKADSTKGERGKVYVGIPAFALKETHNAFAKDKLGPRTIHELAGPDGPLFCGVWADSTEESVSVVETDLDTVGLDGCNLDRLRLDVSVSRNTGLPFDGPLWFLSNSGAGLDRIPWSALGGGPLVDSSPDRRFASIWGNDSSKEALCLSGLTPEQQHQRAVQLVAVGYRPVSWAMAVLAGRVEAVSLWHRPAIPGAELGRNAARKAVAVIALRDLGQTASIWPLLRHKPDPSLRSHLINRLVPLGFDARELLSRLDTEPDPSIRRALIVALGDYGEDKLTAELRGPWVARLLEWYRNDPDPGIHGAIDWLLRHRKEGSELRPLDWGQGKELERIDKELARRLAKAKDDGIILARTGQVNRRVRSELPDLSLEIVPAGFTITEMPEVAPRLEPVSLVEHPRKILRGLSAGTVQAQEKPPENALPRGTEPTWWVNSRGQTFAVVPGPVEFVMGSPAFEADRQETENLHRRRISRTFMIATKSVTVRQFQEFLKAERFDPNFEKLSPDLDGPMNGVNWYDAAAYCRWLSEQEKIPEDQMVYPPVADILKARDTRDSETPVKLELPAGHLSRRGYRLPTEAEWEFVCRAGASTTRFYGMDDTLMGRYAWHDKNSGDRAWPVGQKRPNDLGMFDTFGNVWQWCHEPSQLVGHGLRGRAACPEEPTEVRQNQSYPQRGGGFDSRVTSLRCATRSFDAPRVRFGSIGFRIARTW